MLAWLRRQLSPATVMAFVALVFAMTGGAFAVTGRGGSGAGAGAPRASVSVASVHAVTAKKKKAASTGKPGPRGPAGLAGAQGPAGTAGATGPQGAAGPGGAAGAKGENGVAGTNGTNGTNGASVTSVEKSEGTIGTCKEGGSSFTSASGKTYACNGKTGAPWPAGGTLPVGATETGAWSVGPLKKENTPYGTVRSTIVSFPIELAAPLDSSHVHYINETGGEVTEVVFNGREPVGEETVAQTACPGSIEEPKAVAGNLCIYGAPRTEMFAETGQIASVGEKHPGAGRTGAGQLFFIGTGSAEPEAHGTWAVTG